MNINVIEHMKVRRLNESATDAIAHLCGSLGVLLLLADASPRRRRAYPEHRTGAHSRLSN